MPLTMKFAAAVLTVCMASAAVPVAAQPTQAPEAGAPAALAPEEVAKKYSDIASRFPTDLRWAAFIDNQSTTPRFTPQPDGSEPYPWPKFAELLEQQQPLIRELIANANEPECRFPAFKSGTDYEKVGGGLRKCSRVLRADASRLWAAGDTDGAVERLTAIYGLIRHGASQTDAIQLLTAAAILKFANEATATFAGADKPGLTKPQAQRLLDAVNQIDDAALERLAKPQRDIASRPGAPADGKDRTEKAIDTQRQNVADTKAALEKIIKP